MSGLWREPLIFDFSDMRKIALTIALLVPNSLFAALQLAADQKELPAATDYSYYCEPTANEMLDPALIRTELFKKGQTQQNFGYLTHQSCWTEIDVLSLDSQPRVIYLEHGLSQEDVIRVYQKNLAGWQYIGRAGNLYPVDAWPVHYRLPTFEVQLQPGLNTLRIYQVTRDITGIDWKIWEPKRFHRAVDWENLLFGGFFAICLALSFYNLVIFAVSRDVSHLYYFLYLSTYGWVQMFVTGFLKLLLPEMGPALGILGLGSISVGMLFVYLFVGNILEVSKFPKWLQRMYWSLAWVSFSNIFLVFFGPFEVAARNCLIGTGFGSIIGLLFGAYALKRRTPLAPLFMLAWSMLLFGTTLQVAAISGLIDNNPVTKSANFIGATIEAILISYALAFKMKRERLIETKRRKHAFSQLEKMVYPHQLSLMKEGHQLEQTMPLAIGQACVICVDMINSSKQNIGELKDFLRDFFNECDAIMNRDYLETGMQAYGFRIKEMGDGFLCSIGFPFAAPGQLSIRELAMDMALDFVQKFEEVLQKTPLTALSEPILSIGIAEGPIEGFFTLSGIRSYELFGKGIVLATRYEALRKIYRIPGDGHLICLKSTVFAALPARHQQSFMRFSLEKSQQFIRDDESVQDFYYQRIPSSYRKAINTSRTA